MKLIRQSVINDARLLSSSIVENDYPAWSEATTYAQGSHVVHQHRIMQSVQSGNVNHDPELGDVAWWVDVGPSNRWAMFDGVVGTLSSAVNNLTVTLAPGRIDAVALLQVDAGEVTVTMNRGVEILYTRTVSMVDNSVVIDWLSYFFEPVISKDYVLLTDLPVFGDATVTITLSKPSGTVSCGLCIVGLQSDLGNTLRSPTVGIADYSRKTTDEFGNTDLVRRSFAKKMGVKLKLNNSDLDRIHSVLTEVRATPAIWVGSDRYSSMLVYGFYRDFEVDIAYARYSYCTLNIEGMI